MDTFWLSNTAAVMAPIADKLSDIYGKKNVQIIIMAMFMGSIAAAAGFSTNISVLIASRIIRDIILSYERIIFISD